MSYGSASTNRCAAHVSRLPGHIRRSSFHAPRGFSLVELLVVIGIIALLISILLPAVNAARERGNQLKCLANLHSISQAAEMHVLDHHGYLPAAGHHWDLIGGQLTPAGLGDSDARDRKSVV